MTIRSVTTMSVLALVSACSSQPGPSATNATAQAHNAFRAGNIAAAESAYDAALAANPKDASALVGLGEVYEKTGRKSEAIKLYTRARDQRSGAIRVWNDGRVMQDGITEIATRRLSVLGHQKKAIVKNLTPKKPNSKQILKETKPIATLQPVAPVAIAHHQPAVPVTVQSQPLAPLIATPIQTIAPLVAVQESQGVFTTAAIAPKTIPFTSENSGYSLDSEGVVYYTDPEATQPLTKRSTGTVYFSDPEATQPITTLVSEFPNLPNQQHSLSTTMPQPALATTAIMLSPSEITPLPVYQATTSLAPVHAEVSAQIDIATYQAEPIVDQPAPAPGVQSRVPALKPVSKITTPAPSFTAPAPTVKRSSTAITSSHQPLPRSQPGYAVIGGDLVYISAEDIANGAVGRPVAEPIKSDPLNGTSIPNLN